MPSPTQAPAKEESASEEDEKNARLERIRAFNLKPREIRDHLDRFVIEQREAKKVLSVAICDHYNHVRRCLEDEAAAQPDYAKQNILVLGPTGVGKTYLMRCVARLIGVPFVKADATKFSETGYMGGDVEDLVRDLVKAADGDLELAQYGIIYVDEIDKIASAARAEGGGGRDVSGRGVQINLLKLMEETDVNLHSQSDIAGQMQAMMEMQRGGRPKKKTLNTRHILFIVSGAFDGLAERVRRRVEHAQIGFASSSGEAVQAKSERHLSEYLHQVESGDIIGYGMEPEFVGRLPVRVACQALTPDDLNKVLLTSEGSVLQQYRADFSGYGIDFDISSAAIKEIAHLAHRENTGARGLMTVLERVFRPFKFELPSTGIKSFKVSTDTVAKPTAELDKLLRANAEAQREVLRAEVGGFAARFYEEHGYTLDFRDDAITALIDASIATDKTIRALCEGRFATFHHGLKLIAREGHSKVFMIDASVVQDPEKAISRWVVDAFKPTDSPPSAGDLT